MRTKLVGSREKLALIIPTFEEAGNVGGLLMRVRTVLDGAEIPWEAIVVDDDSRDGTEEIVSAMARADARVRLLVRQRQRGLSGAVLHGWEHTDATMLGVMDADGQHPPEILPELVGSIRRGCDVAIGSRYAHGGRCGWNPMRRLLSRAAILAACPLQPSPLRVKDPLSGFFLVRRSCVDQFEFQTTGFKLLLDILVRGRVSSVEEVPFALGRRGAGRSKVSATVAWDYATLLTRLYRTRFGMPRVPEAASGD